MRRSFDGLMAIIRDTYQMDPYANAVYLFCGKRKNTLKALYFDKDGFCLSSKRLDSNGRFQWPRNSSEVRQLTRQASRIADQEATIKELRIMVDELRSLKANLEETLEEFRRQFFGVRSEKTSASKKVILPSVRRKLHVKNSMQIFRSVKSYAQYQQKNANATGVRTRWFLLMHLHL